MILWLVLVGELIIVWLLSAYFLFVKSNGEQNILDAFVFAAGCTLWTWGMLR